MEICSDASLQFVVSFTLIGIAMPQGVGVRDKTRRLLLLVANIVPSSTAREPLVASLLLVAMPGAPSSFWLLVANALCFF